MKDSLATAFAALLTALLLSGCATLSGRPEPAATVTDQKPGVEAAYKVLKNGVEQKVLPGLKIEEYAEVGCRASQPVNLETRWELNAYIPGGVNSGKKIVSLYQKHGWNLDKGATWLDEKKTDPVGDDNIIIVAGLKRGSTYLSLEVTKRTPKTVNIFAATDCVVQPLDRSPETDPADPNYVTPTPTPSISFPNRTEF